MLEMAPENEKVADEENVSVEVTDTAALGLDEVLVLREKKSLPEAEGLAVIDIDIVSEGVTVTKIVGVRQAVELMEYVLDGETE